MELSLERDVCYDGQQTNLALVLERECLQFPGLFATQTQLKDYPKGSCCIGLQNVQKCKGPMENYFLRVRSSADVSFKVGVG